MRRMLALTATGPSAGSDTDRAAFRRCFGHLRAFVAGHVVIPPDFVMAEPVAWDGLSTWSDQPCGFISGLATLNRGKPRSSGSPSAGIPWMWASYDPG